MNKAARLLRHEWPLHASLLMTSWLPDNVLVYRLRGALARLFFGSCGRNLRICRGLYIDNPAKIHLGSSVYVAHGCCFLANAEIWIEDEVMLAPYCVIATGNHTRVNGSFYYGAVRAAPIRLGKGSWLGAHVTVTAGVTVGAGSAVAAGAVVIRDLPPNVLAAGIPARVIKELSD